MLSGEKLKGLDEILSSFGQEQESDNSRERERMKRFAAAVMKEGLTPRQKTLMCLIYVEGLNQKQAGERLNMSQPAVSSMHRRAVERMRELSRFLV